MKRLLLAFYCICATLTTLAADISGKITDETGAALGFASLLIKNTTIGTSANEDGRYLLQVAPGTYTIVCQFIGYETQSRTITVGASGAVIDFQLRPQKLSMNEVVVKADKEDPAYAIMREVIKRRKEHAARIKTLETKIYLKGAIRTRSFPDMIMGVKIQNDDMKDVNGQLGLDSSGKGILYLLEEVSHYYYKAPDKSYNKVRSLRTAGDPNGLGFATMPPIINIYENNIDMLGLNERGFISPAHSNAFYYYRYKFLGSFLEDGRQIDKIAVIPKRKFEPLFTGNLYVVDGEWVFSAVDLKLTPTSQMSSLDTLGFKQYFTPIKENIWIIHSQVLHPTLNIIGIDAAGDFVTAYSGQKVNIPLNDSLFESKVLAEYDSNANSKPVAYWDSIRPIPLRKDEIKDYQYKDSLFIAQKRSADSISRTTHVVLDPISFLFGDPHIQANKNRFSIRPLGRAIAYNTVEGINATLDLTWEHQIDSGKKANLRLLNRYGFGNRHYNFYALASYEIQPPAYRERSTTIELSGGRYIFQINPDNPIGSLMNEAYTLLGGRNYMKLYESEEIGLRFAKSWGNGWQLHTAISYERRLPLENVTDYTFNPDHRARLTANQPPGKLLTASDAALVGLRIQYQPGWRYIRYPKYLQPIHSSWPTIALSYTKGIPDIASSVANFDKWRLDITDDLSLNLLGNVDYHVAAGGFLNKKEVNLPDWNHLNGNRTFLASPFLNSFQLAPYYKFSNTNPLYLEAHAEWHLGGLLTNKIPLFRRLNWFLLAGANVYYASENSRYAELFVGLENIGWKLFRFGRVDLIAGYEDRSTPAYWGVRISVGNFLSQLLHGKPNKYL